MPYINRIKIWSAGDNLTHTDLNAEFDLAINSQIPEPASVAQGDILFRGAAAWQRLGQSNKGKALETGGPSANPSWQGFTGQGQIEYHNGTVRTALAVGTSGRILTTKGSGQNPAWADFFPPNTNWKFYQDTAPAGWTIQNLDDKVVYITKGSAAGGETGGAAHSSGTWTQPNHTHTIADHTHSVSITSGGPSATDNAPIDGYVRCSTSHTHLVSGNTGAGGTGTTGAGASANTWRPAGYCFIICAKD